MELRKIHVPVPSLSRPPLVAVTRTPLAATHRVSKNKVESNSPAVV